MGLTEEEYEKQTAESAAESAKEKLAIAAIAKKAGISLSDDDVKAAAETEYSDYGYDSADALLSAIGQGAYYDYVLSDKVNEYLINQVTIVEMIRSPLQRRILQQRIPQRKMWKKNCRKKKAFREKMLQ